MNQENLAEIFTEAGTVAPGNTGDALAHLLLALEHREAKNTLRSTYKDILEYFGLPAAHPLAEAGMEIARLIDEEVPVPGGGANYGGKGNGYHNKNHMLEVMTSAATLLATHAHLGHLPALSPDDQLLLVTAALAHDIGHNGKGNGREPNRVPMMAEKYSVALARPIIETTFAKAGRADELPRTMARFNALICATDISGGPASPGKFFADIAKFQRGEHQAAPPIPAPALAEFFPLLAPDRILTELSCLLQDADLLPSIGLTPEWGEFQDLRMGQEEPSRMTASGTVDWSGTKWFHDNLAELKSMAGRYYGDNFAAIRRDAARMLQKQIQGRVP